MERQSRRHKRGLDYIEEARARGYEARIGNPDLPVTQHFPEIADAIRDHPIVIVISETGSGKSTQIPQLALEMGYTVDQTQPLRSSAHELTGRIRYELQQAVPELPDSIIGTHTGVECTVQPDTELQVMTAGTWLAVNYNSSTNRLNQPRDGKHLIMHDEVHEMKVETEVSLALSIQELRNNPELRIVLSTATPNKDMLIERIEEISGIVPYVVEVPGKHFKLDIHERPDLTAVSAIHEYSEPGMGTLIFKPGLGEIKDTIRELERAFLPGQKVKIFRAHSSLSPAEISAACNYEPAPDEIKIVVGTNTLETGHTVAGIKYVIDDGIARQTQLSKHGYTELVFVDISQDRANQRAGRAGRICDGVVARVRPDNKRPFVPQADRAEFETPEILRRDLRDVVLQLAVIGIDLAEFALITEVSPLAIIRAKESLHIVGALDDDGKVTAIGVEMNKYPVRPMLQRAIVESQKYDEDIQHLVAAMAAAVETGGLPMHTRYTSKGWRDVSDESSSDLLGQLDLFIHARGMREFDQTQLGLNPRSIKDANITYGKNLYHLGLEESPLVQPTELQRQAMIECIYAGYVENVFRRIGRNAYRMLQGPQDIVYHLSDRSVVDARQADMVVGMPYAVERLRKGKPFKASIIESVTRVPEINALGNAAVRMAVWSPEQVEWRNGRAFLGRDQSIRGVSTGKRQEHMGESDDMYTYRRDIINQVLTQPGPAQRELRAIKKALEELAHLSQDRVPTMKQEDLIGFISEANDKQN